MNGMSASPAKAAPAETHQRTILVWDVPTRLFHWLLVLSFGGAYLTAESESWRLLHVTLGYTMALLVGFRILWGVVGSRHARFATFVRGPGAVAAYLKRLLQGRPKHYTGHNPAGAVAIVGLLALALAVSASGYAAYNDLAGDWVQELHEVTANLMLAIVGVHIAGVLLASWLHRENLVGAMFTGRKQGAPEDGIRRAWRGVAALLLMAVLALWWVQGQSALQSGNLADRPVPATRAADRDND